jgi:hypothetical protein
MVATRPHTRVLPLFVLQNPTRRWPERQSSSGAADRVAIVGPDLFQVALPRALFGVPPAGFEPAISALKGLRPGPLDDEGLLCRGRLF